MTESTVLGVQLVKGDEYRVVTDTDGQVLDRQAVFLNLDDATLVMDTRRVVDGELVGGTSWIPISDVQLIESVAPSD